jgi:NADPH2:quinone reductase
MAADVDFPDELAIELPDGVDDAVAAAAGIAGVAGYMPVARIAGITPSDRVLVLGASGTVGSVAVQTAKAMGAARVVAAGRDPEKLERVRELGADAVVRLGDPYEEQFDVIVDPLWGEPIAKALDEAAAPGARVVHLGQSAGAEATLKSGTVRGKQLRILGYSNFALLHDELRERYLELLDHVAGGRIRIEPVTFPLDRVADAWAALEAGRKPVVTL